MLSRQRTLGLLGACALAGLASGARGQDGTGGDLRRPRRLTVGVGDQYLGQLAPDGQTLYFLSNRNTTTELFHQPVEDDRVRRLFDEGADVSWPRVSPDGRSLLYISFRERAGGQLCVRDLPGAGGRRCLEDPEAALQAEWIDRDRIALVSRPSIHGDLSLKEVTVGSPLVASSLPVRNAISPAVSPDGRWLVHVPVQRYTQQVGPGFAAHASPRLEVVQLGPKGTPSRLLLRVPGVSSQPAFSPDGRHMYFVQFMADTNHDGVVDANDHGILFRVPFPQDRDDAPALAAAAFPEQLTQASWNCQYPYPAADRLVFTCSRNENLDVYALPSDGAVPPDWTSDRLAMESWDASSRTEKLFLDRHRLARVTSPLDQSFLLMELAHLHLELDEFAAAGFYARQVGSLPDPTLARLSGPLLVLVEQRQASSDRENGRAVGRFRESARRRLESLRSEPDDPPAVAALRHVVRSEVADSLGDLATARSELSAVPVDETLPAGVLAAYYDRADALYRALDDRESLVAAGRRLAGIEALPDGEQLEYARGAARALLRGLPTAEAESALARARTTVAEGSELAFALDLSIAVLAIRERQPPPAVGDAVVALLRGQARADRRWAVITDAVRRAGEVDADPLVERLAEEHVRAARPGTTERRRAERFYERALVGRAYREAAAGRLAEARADFDAVHRVTGSLETAVASIEIRLRSGEKLPAIAAGYEQQATGKPVDHFVKAYLIARAIPQLEGEKHAKAVAEARAEIQGSWKSLRQSSVAQALFGAILHEDFLGTGSLVSAERANEHFLLALELVRNNPRYRAMILGQLALLHVEVGNFRIALGYLEDREKLPFVENASGLAVRMARARALLHVEQEADAATAADEALEMTDSRRLTGYRVVALDRAALYSLAADRFPAALALYDAEIPLLESAGGPDVGANLVRVRLARAAAALGAGQPQRALDDLDAVDRALRDPAVAATLPRPRTDPRGVLRTYRLIASGLRANADEKLGNLGEASRALVIRRDLFLEEFQQSGLVENLRALTLAEARLAVNAGERKEVQEAGKWIGRALDHADLLAKRAKTGLDGDQLSVFLIAAELGARGHAPVPADLTARLRQAHGKLGERKDAEGRSFQRWFEIYLTLLAPPASK